MLDTNLTSAFLCSQAAYPEMKRAGGGKMINIGVDDVAVRRALCDGVCGEQGRHRADDPGLATAWAKDNIQVNAVLPGWIDTDLTQRRAPAGGGPARQRRKAHATGRWGTPDDMAGIAAFLASPASDFVTGAAIPVDGGFSIGM